MDGGRPKRYRPESPAGPDRPDLHRPRPGTGTAEPRPRGGHRARRPRPWSRSSPAGPCSSSSRTMWPAPAARSALLAPADAYPLLAPALRRPYSAGRRPRALRDQSGGPRLRDGGRDRRRTPEPGRGCPIIRVVDDRSAILALATGRRGARPLEHRSRVRGRRAARARAASRAMSDDLLDEAYRRAPARVPGGATRPRSPSFGNDIAAFRARRREAAAALTQPDSIGSPARVARTAFPRSASVAREMEQWVAPSSPPAARPARLDAAVDRLERRSSVARAQAGHAGTEVGRRRGSARGSSSRLGADRDRIAGGARQAQVTTCELRRPHRGSAHGDPRPSGRISW